MFSVIRRRFTYANVAVTLALVFAMSGGAYAASRYVITSTRQISPKALKALKGHAGVNGAQGAAGPAGATGPAGPAGSQGPAGQTGKEGPPGKNGENGKDGTTGFTETLPAEKTESGDWGVSSPEAHAESFLPVVGASFNIPLTTAPSAHYIRANGKEPFLNGHQEIEERISSVCHGSAAAPSAEPGNLCVYAEAEENTLKGVLSTILPGICALGSEKSAIECIQDLGADRTGFGIVVASEVAGSVETWGTWAVTAE